MAGLDPVEKVLLDLGVARAAAHTELLRLPAPSPFKRALEDVDKLLGRLEDDVRSVHGTVKTPLERPGPWPDLRRQIETLFRMRPGSSAPGR